MKNFLFQLSLSMILYIIIDLLYRIAFKQSIFENIPIYIIVWLACIIFPVTLNNKINSK